MGNSIFDDIREKWGEKHRKIVRDLSEKHQDTLALVNINAKQFALAAASAVSLATSPILPVIAPGVPMVVQQSQEKEIDRKVFLISDLDHVLPEDVRELTPEEDKKIIEILSRTYKLPIYDSLEGIRLNRTYGYIGQEQHLARYPGDSIGIHFDNPQDAEKYSQYGMAPGLGAWGYFAPSKNELTQDDIDREKYYIAVQTFLAPGFHDNVRRYITFFKYRKMLVVNPNNGRAMVVVVGDAGPGESTGKHLGGSPEVMKYLERYDGRQKGPVLYYFIDDPNDTVPLGPIDIR